MSKIWIPSCNKRIQYKGRNWDMTAPPFFQVQNNNRMVFLFDNKHSQTYHHVNNLCEACMKRNKGNINQTRNILDSRNTIDPKKSEKLRHLQKDRCQLGLRKNNKVKILPSQVKVCSKNGSCYLMFCWQHEI